jgi:CubicO group peptidase (beta-lactamase class C family)
MMSQEALAEFVTQAAEKFGVPGAAVGVWHAGEEFVACHGVTSLADPLPIDRHTAFPLGSISKTFTATVLLRLLADGTVELDAPVRRYLPDLRLADESAAERITILNLLNHTSGLEWNLIDPEADLTLAAFADKLAELPFVAPPNTRASYSQAAFNLLGRVVEVVTGKPFEKAVAETVLEPLGLSETSYDVDDVMVRRFALGYNQGDDGELNVAKPWKAYPAGTRGNSPGGGITSTLDDMLSWSRFHIGDGADVLPAPILHSMRKQTVELRGSTLGDGFGLCWFLRDVDGVATIGHGGSGNGQFSEVLIAPDRDFAVVALANLYPDGYQFNQAVLRWALEHYLGAVEKDPEPVPYDDTRARAAAGRYELDVMELTVASDGQRLTLAVGIKSEVRASSDADMPQDYPAAEIGYLQGDGDDYIITGGGLAGQRGYFTRDGDGVIVGIDLAGRMFHRTAR